VATTTTLNGSWGSGVWVRGAGFFLNNEMDDFAAQPGMPNMFGLVQGEQNAIQPGKRMLSAMSPTIVLDSSQQVLLVVGAAGGPTIITGTVAGDSQRARSSHEPRRRDACAAPASSGAPRFAHHRDRRRGAGGAGLAARHGLVTAPAAIARERQRDHARERRLGGVPEPRRSGGAVGH
jgi:gamma-glutamyltranspeptidase / glutathione hydrolase